jgi:phytoene dehydrogenase-like protein
MARLAWIGVYRRFHDMPHTDYDILIVGGGHNGLVAAAYLARAGQRVLVLERREILGGACVTEELFPGCRFSACSYICHLLQTQVIEDLELRRHGFEVYHLDPSRFVPFPDGRCLLTWDDVARTQEEIGRFSARDAAAYPRWIAFWERAAGLLHRYFLTPPPTLAEVLAALRGTADEALFERLLTAGMQDLVEEFFEDEAVRGAFIQAQDAGDPAAPGSALCYAYIKCNAFSKPENVGIVRGGMGGITQAMARAAREAGAELRTGVAVERLLIESGRALGARLADGTEIRARVVLSNADPKRTFLRLVGTEHLPPEFVGRVERLKTRAAYLKFHAVLRDLPDFSRHLGTGFDPRYLASTKICPTVAYFASSWEDAKHGRPSRTPVMEVQIPSVCDPTMAPAGHHVMSIWSLYAPVRPCEAGEWAQPRGPGPGWDERRQEVGEQLIATLAQYIPNLREILVDWSLFTPLDIERRVGMTDGNIRHLDIVPSQLLAARPLPGWAHYRTPIAGLYLCGAGTHPGGEVTGAPGHNAAQVVLAAMGGEA